MTNSLKTLFTTLSLLFALTLVSCVYERDICTDSSSTDKVQVKFTIAMDNLANTRGSWATDVPAETNANEYENTISVGKLQVFFYGSDDKLLGEVKDLSYLRDNENDNIYNILGNMELTPSQSDDSQTYSDCKIVVLANHATITAPETINGFSSIVETPDLDKIKSETEYIPMWGVKKYSSLTLTKGSCEDAGDIYMLRAMAKIEVSLSETLAKSYTIESISLTKGNSTANLQPTLALVTTTENDDNTTTTSTKTYTSLAEYCSKLADKGGTDNLDSQACLNAVNNSTTESDKTNIPFWYEKEDDKTKMILYVPEYKQESDPATFTVKVKSTETGATETYTMQLKKYDENGEPTGDPLDLVRNNIYKYTITGIAPGDLTVLFAINPWSEVVSQIGYDAQVGTKADFVMYAKDQSTTSDNKTANVLGINNVKDGNGDTEGLICTISYPRQVKYFSSSTEKDSKTLSYGSAGAAFEFKLTKPKGAVWRAYLKGDYKDNFQFSTGTIKDESTQHYTATGIARDDFYYINITAKNPWYSRFTEDNDESYSEDENYVCINGDYVQYDKDNATHISPDTKKYTFNSTDFGVNSDGNSTLKKSDWGYQWEKGDGFGKGTGPWVDLRIQVSLDGENFYDLEINPVNTSLSTYYNDKRRFAVGKVDDDANYRIRIWQVKAVSGVTAPYYGKNNKLNTTFTE